jgi:hypothetical protein
MLTDLPRSAHHDPPSAVLPEKHFHQSLRIGEVESRGLVAVVEARCLVNRNGALMTFQGDGQWNPMRAIPNRLQISVIGEHRWRKSLMKRRDKARLHKGR